MSEATTSSETMEDNGVSMVDILEEEERLEADATAVLGDSDDKNCTYPKGNVNRQALYACNTCSTGSKEPGGVCLACSYECHEGHDLVELYTKRFFKCDCGNSRFPDLKCKLYPEKDAVNISNKYNHNFNGLYCTCSRPYPDPDDEVEDDMIQCVICEDWFHGRHLSSSPPENQDYSEVVCAGCMKKNDFLWAYVENSPITVVKKEESSSEVDVVRSESDNSESTAASRSETISTVSSGSVGSSSYAGSESVSTSTAEESTSGASTSSCLLKDLRARKTNVKKEAVFWPDSWRKKLCQCPDCMIMYEDAGVLFLTDELDTVEAYEERGRQKNEPVSQHTKEVNALSQMNRIQQIEVVQGFNDLKSELSEYLRKFAENGKVVREEDIREFFSGLEARKRKKKDPGFQYNCK